jgi:hypothetical protein
MLMPKGGDGGADGDVHYVAVEQDLDQSPEGPRVRTRSVPVVGG